MQGPLHLHMPAVPLGHCFGGKEEAVETRPLLPARGGALGPGRVLPPGRSTSRARAFFMCLQGVHLLPVRLELRAAGFGVPFSSIIEFPVYGSGV